MAGAAGERDSYERIRRALREELQHFANTVLMEQLNDLRDRLTQQFESRDAFSDDVPPLPVRNASIEKESSSHGIFNFRNPIQLISPIVKTTGLSMLFSTNRISTCHSDQGEGEMAHVVSNGRKSIVSSPSAPQTFRTASANSFGYVPLRLHDEFREQRDEQRTSTQIQEKDVEAKGSPRPFICRSLSAETHFEKSPQTHISLSRVDRGTSPVRNSGTFEFFSTPTSNKATRRSEPNFARTLLLRGWVYPLTGLLITMNAMSIGFETDYMARNWTDHAPRLYRICDIAFLVYFVFEIALRIYAYRITFFTGRAYIGNMFDFGMVILQLADVVIKELLKHWAKRLSHQLMIWRIFRILRVLRIFRFFRILHMFTGLRMLLIGIQDSLKSLVWSMVFIFLMIYSLGVCLTQVVTNYKVQNAGGRRIHDLEAFYGSVENSMLSLYEAISDGIHWHDLLEPLRQSCSPWMALFFVVYIAFAMFAMLNVITGTFVESAIEAARQDKRQILMNQMVSLFLEADEDGSGTVDKEEFNRCLGSEQMAHILKEVDLNSDEAMDLFYILDTQGEGEIQAEAFVNGCLRLNGSAKAIDLAAFMHEFKLFQVAWHQHSEFQAEALRKIYKEMQFGSVRGSPRSFQRQAS